MAKQSMIFSQQQNKLGFSCMAEDYMALVGILLLLQHYRHLRQKLHWSLDPNTDCFLVKEAMPKKHVHNSKQYLHFNV